jgi:hypothetical protein
LFLINPIHLLFCFLALYSANSHANECTSGDCYSGQGTYSYVNGDRYEGQYKDGKPNGQGTYSYVNGDRYKGQFKDNKYDGQGTLTFADKSRYEGQYKDGKPNGQGTYSYVNGDRYKGQFKDDKFDGQGTYSFVNGDRYKGQYKDGKPNGQGTYSFADKSRYKGQFKDNKYDGQGTLTFADKSRYEGQFKDDKFDGLGTYDYLDGTRHEGQYKDDKPNGQGTLTFADKSRYEGRFKDGIFYGQGSTSNAAGRRYDGQFRDNRFNGLGTTYFVNGDRHQGQYKDGKKQGKGTLYYADGTEERGAWEDDELVKARAVTSGGEIVIVPEEHVDVGEYYALIIGVSEYDNSSRKLKNLDFPVKDARKINDLIQSKYGFDNDNVSFLKNPTRDEIYREFERLQDKLTSKDNLLVIYSGHGYWDIKTKQGYWLARDAEYPSRARWLSNSSILDFMKVIDTKHTLLISDACFSGGIINTRSVGFGAADQSIKALYSSTSRRAMTSGALTEVPDDSVFMKYLLKQLNSNSADYLSASELFESFRYKVMNNTKPKTIPQDGVMHNTGDEGGDFIFSKK